MKRRTQWVKGVTGKTHKHGGTRRSEEPKPEHDHGGGVVTFPSVARDRGHGSKKERLRTRWAEKDRFGIAKAMGQIRG